VVQSRLTSTSGRGSPQSFKYCRLNRRATSFFPCFLLHCSSRTEQWSSAEKLITIRTLNQQLYYASRMLIQTDWTRVASLCCRLRHQNTQNHIGLHSQLLAVRVVACVHILASQDPLEWWSKKFGFALYVGRRAVVMRRRLRVWRGFVLRHFCEF